MDVRGNANTFVPPAYPPQVDQATKNILGIQQYPLAPLNTSQRGIGTGNVNGIPPLFMPSSASASKSTVVERRTGKKIRIAVILTVCFVILQLHPVILVMDKIHGTLFLKPFDLSNEYGCITAKGAIITTLLFFFIALYLIRAL